MRFVDGVRLGRTSLYDEVTSRIADATVAALLIAKASLAGERGVELRLLPDSRVGKVYGALSRDLATVVGNLVDNALDAAASARRRTPRVDVLVNGRRRRRRGRASRDSGPGRARRRGGLPAGLDRPRRSPRRRGPRLRAGADPAGVPAPRRRRDVCTTTAGPCSPRRCPTRPTTGTRRVDGSDRGAGRRRRLHGGPDPHRLRRAHARLHGHRRRAHGGRGAAEAERLQPDLVLLDVYLPDVSGLDLLGALREAAPEVDVLVISAAREADTVRRALRGGIVHYLMKPFSYDDLRVRLEHYQQAYIGLPSEQTDQADVDRVFGVPRQRQTAAQGVQPRDPAAGRGLAAPGDRRPLRGRGGQPARDLPGQRPAGTSSTSRRPARSRSACATGRSAARSAATPGGDRFAVRGHLTVILGDGYDCYP